MSEEKKSQKSPNTRSKEKGTTQSSTGQDGPESTANNASASPAEISQQNDEQDESSRASTPSTTQGPFGSSSRKEIYDAFQKWALKTYGDSAKTKTVTKKKRSRIMKILKGEEQSTSENSKFRFWVKAKGFRIGPPEELKTKDGTADDQELYVPCTKIGAVTVTNTDGVKDPALITYKRVAVVENFFDIIYEVHVEMDGRGGKHAGQKRTYKAIAETYAFLPREAVTRFLMSCSDCQKRMHLGQDGPGSATPSPDEDVPSVISAGSSPDFQENGSSMHDTIAADIDYSLPITTTYLKHMRSLGYSEEDALNPDREDCSPHAESESSGDCQILHHDNVGDQVEHMQTEDEEPVDMSSSIADQSVTAAREIIIQGINDKGQPIIATTSASAAKTLQAMGLQTHQMQTSGGDATGENMDEGIEDLSVGTKDDDEEEDDEECEKFDPRKYDPERLKAFNMFVRLFVDENLDRMVPISKQPKEKIQAIIDSCQRQFPEFAGRSRKRIRTYLKSCRRNKRTRDQLGYDLPSRPTPPHLTSAVAEQLLAVACENESNNAKRMRLGLQPLSTTPVVPTEVDHRPKVVLAPAPTPLTLLNAKPVFQITTKLPSEPPRIVVQTQPATTTSTPILLQSLVNGKSSVQSTNMITYQAATGIPASLTQTISQQHSAITSSQPHQQFNTMVVNGAADLRVKKSANPQAKCPLNQSEVTAVRQLIAGYRESAAFLIRSADELEQLLLQQN
ncbi:NOL4 (predicted) [Pycnogonum litorale]